MREWPAWPGPRPPPPATVPERGRPRGEVPEPLNPLEAVLTDARRLGYLGPGAVEDHLVHAAQLAAALAALGSPPLRSADLGSGSGVPGLALALLWPTSRWSLIEVSRRRSAFLRDAVGQLGLDARVEVVEGRSEVAGRDPSYRGRHDLVVARAFGAPGVVAENAAPLLGLDGRLVVTEPPAPQAPWSRWPAAGLAQLGLVSEHRLLRPQAVVLVQASPCPDRFPRRPGIPAKRPVF